MVKAFSGFGIKIWLRDVEIVLDQLGVPRARACDAVGDAAYKINISI